ncbi:hypothetical protein GCM10009575_025650 [Streptomyces rhizosphaericus]|uniref:Uncharacterized protein n=1 Tax=Streptomyces rhizosphaericus TaxID=114699 RepID=A0ABN1PCZ4_9ACTN
MGWGTDGQGQHAVAQAGGVPLDAVEDGGGRVAAIAVGNVRVSPDRVDVAHRARGVGEVLLGDEDKGSTGQMAAGHGLFGVGDLVRAAADVDGARRAARVGPPGHTAFDGQVDLVCGGAVPVAGVRASDSVGQPRAAHGRRRARGQIEEDGAGRRQVAQGADGAARFDDAAEFRQPGGEGVGDGTGAPTGHGPAVPVRSRREHELDRGTARAGEGTQRVSGGPGEQGACRFAMPAAGCRPGGGRRPQTESGGQDRMARQPCHGPHPVVDQCVVVRGQRREQAPPGGSVPAQPPCGDGQVAVEHRGVAAVEGVGEVGLGVRPVKSVAFES